jgi:hypothetical protein
LLAQVRRELRVFRWPITFANVSFETWPARADRACGGRPFPQVSAGSPSHD